jgi:hypothetical protein
MPFVILSKQHYSHFPPIEEPAFSAMSTNTNRKRVMTNSCGRDCSHGFNFQPCATQR